MSGPSSIAASDPNISSLKEDSPHHEEYPIMPSVIDDPQQTKWQTMRRRPKATFWIAALIFSLCLSGFDNQAGLGVLGIEQFREDFGHPYGGDYVIPARWLSAFNGGGLATGILGALLGSWMTERIGRKKVVIAAIANTFIGVTLEFRANSDVLFLAGKLVNGTSVGILNTVCVAYVSEISPVPLRGVATAACNFCLSIGPLIVPILGVVYGSQHTPWAYRGIFIGQYAFAGIALPLSLFFPESPWYLARRKDYHAAHKVLLRLSYTTSEADALLLAIRATDEHSHRLSKSSSFAHCFTGTNLRRTILAIVPITCQAWSGIAWLGMYQTYLFELNGYSVSRSFQLSCASMALQLFGCIVTWPLLDIVGRRPLLFYGTGFSAILYFLIGALCAAGTASAFKGAITVICLAQFIYSIALGSVAYTVAAEIPTQRLRPKTIAIAITMQLIGYMIQVFVLPYIVDPDQGNLGGKTAFIYGGLLSLFCVWFGLYHPETRRRTFAEIDDMFEAGVSARAFANWQGHEQGVEKGQGGVVSRAESLFTTERKRSEGTTTTIA